MSEKSEIEPLPAEGMVISIRTRQDLVIVDPERFLATARRAFQEVTAGTAAEAEAAVVDVYDAVHALLDRYGQLAGEELPFDIPPVHYQIPADPHTTGGRPGVRAVDRPDGLSPAGWVLRIDFDATVPLQDYGCFQPDDPFTVPPTDAGSSR